MSDQQHMDDFFKRGLGDYAPLVPDGTFERIIEERKKRRTAIVWWRNWRNLKFPIIFITAALVASGSFLLLNDKKSTTGQFAETGQPTSNTKAPLANSEEEKMDEPVVSGADSSTVKSISSRAAGNVASAETTTQPLLLNDDNSSTVSNNSAGEQSSGATEKAISPVGKRSGGKSKKAGGKMFMKASPINIETVDVNKDSDEVETPVAMAGDPKNAESKLDKIPFNLSIITAASLADSNKAVVTNNIKGPDCPEAEKNAAGNKTYWEAYSSIDYGSKKYADTANSMFAAKRKETTSFHSGFSAGARVTKVFSNGVSVRAGLNFSQINEKFSFVQSNTVQTTYIIDALTGDTTGSYIVRGTKYKTSFNRYRTLDIPLAIGYEVGNGRLHANFNAGAVINLYSWQKGELLDTAFQPVSITTGKGVPAFQYKTNIGVGFTAAASVYYKLNDRLHLLAEPYFRYNFSPMNREALSLQERFTTMGMRLGIRIDF